MSGADLQNVINFGFSLNNVSPFLTSITVAFVNLLKKQKLRAFAERAINLFNYRRVFFKM